MERRLLAWLPDDGEIMGSNPAPTIYSNFFKCLSLERNYII